MVSKETSKFLKHGAETLGLGQSKVMIMSLRPPFLRDIRTLFDQEGADDDELYNFYLKDIDLMKMGKINTLKKIATRVNKRMEYVSDIKNMKRAEYWQSPIQAHRNARGDCDDYSMLICYLARLAGISPFEIFVRAGDVQEDSGKMVGHAHCIFFDWDSNEWYSVEGSFKPLTSLGYLGKIPMREDPTYANLPTYFITNDASSFSTYPFRLVR